MSTFSNNKTIFTNTKINKKSDDLKIVSKYNFYKCPHTISGINIIIDLNTNYFNLSRAIRSYLTNYNFRFGKFQNKHNLNLNSIDLNVKSLLDEYFKSSEYLEIYYKTINKKFTYEIKNNRYGGIYSKKIILQSLFKWIGFNKNLNDLIVIDDEKFFEEYMKLLNIRNVLKDDVEKINFYEKKLVSIVKNKVLNIFEPYKNQFISSYDLLKSDIDCKFTIDIYKKQIFVYYFEIINL